MFVRLKSLKIVVNTDQIHYARESGDNKVHLVFFHSSVNTQYDRLEISGEEWAHIKDCILKGQHNFE